MVSKGAGGQAASQGRGSGAGWAAGGGPDTAPVRAASARPPTLRNRVFSCLNKGDRIYLSELLPGFPIIIAVRCVCASSGAMIQYSLISDDGELCRT